MLSRPNRIIREGVSAGLIGASVVVVWFAVIDTVRGQSFGTPLMLGTMLGSVLAHSSSIRPSTVVIGYTLVHYAAFLGLGIGMATVLHNAERTPSIFLGALMLFACMEIMWLGVTLILVQGYGPLAWWQVLAANLIAATSMTVYLWRRHRSLPRRINQDTRAPIP